MSVLSWADALLLRKVQQAPGPVLDKVLPRLSEAADRGLVWTGVATLMAATGRAENLRAALRGLTSLLVASAMANGPAKLSVRRRDRDGLCLRPADQ